MEKSKELLIEEMKTILFFIDVDSEVLKNHQSIIDRKLEKYEKEN
jgi:hypothetical protein